MKVFHFGEHCSYHLQGEQEVGNPYKDLTVGVEWDMIHITGMAEKRVISSGEQPQVLEK
jgi:hypothetical protein